MTLALAACGGEAGDLLALEVAGGPQDAPVRLTVTEDGRGTCDGGDLEPIPGDLLIDARDVERGLEGLAEEGASFGQQGPAPGNEARSARDGARRSYVARTRAGTVRWAEAQEGLPEVLPRTALLAQELQGELCE